MHPGECVLSLSVPSNKILKNFNVPSLEIVCVAQLLATIFLPKPKHGSMYCMCLKLLSMYEFIAYGLYHMQRNRPFMSKLANVPGDPFMSSMAIQCFSTKLILFCV